jgi:hypothetical protein
MWQRQKIEKVLRDPQQAARRFYTRVKATNFTFSMRWSGRCSERMTAFHGVLAQPEMEKRRCPLVSIPPFGRGFFRHEGLSIR